jgi:hypothetical protein
MSETKEATPKLADLVRAGDAQTEAVRSRLSFSWRGACPMSIW